VYKNELQNEPEQNLERLLELLTGNRKKAMNMIYNAFESKVNGPVFMKDASNKVNDSSGKSN
jgi:hypothetical protein